MKYIKIIIIVIITFNFPCYSDDILKKDIFNGIWAVDADDFQIRSFLAIKKIGNQYLVIRIGIDGSGKDIVLKGIGDQTSDCTLRVQLKNHNYTLKWDKDGDEEWIEMYIDPNVEEYPYFERVEKFSIDKF